MRELTKEQIEQVAGAGAVSPSYGSSSYGNPSYGHKHKHHHKDHHKDPHNSYFTPPSNYGQLPTVYGQPVLY